MKKDKFIYTDGRDVVVTHSTLETKQAHYQLRGITDFGLAIVKASRLPGLAIALIGSVIIANAFFHFIPNAWMEWISFPAVRREVLIIIGSCIAVAGLAWLLLVPDRYALWIETAEGIKKVVVSKSKEYVDQILHAIRRARLTEFIANPGLRK